MYIYIYTYMHQYLYSTCIYIYHDVFLYTYICTCAQVYAHARKLILSTTLTSTCLHTCFGELCPAFCQLSTKRHELKVECGIGSQRCSLQLNPLFSCCYPLCAQAALVCPLHIHPRCRATQRIKTDENRREKQWRS